MRWSAEELRKKGKDAPAYRGRGIDGLARVKDRLVRLLQLEDPGLTKGDASVHVKQWIDRGQFWSRLIKQSGVGVVCFGLTKGK